MDSTVKIDTIYLCRISIGMIVGIYIGFGSKKFGIPIANNKIAKCKKKEKENPK